MADDVERARALLAAFKLIDGIAGEMNGVPNEDPGEDADDVAINLADAFGVSFDEHWPEVVCAAALSADDGRVRLISFAEAKRAGEAMWDRWAHHAESGEAEAGPPLNRSDAAWADLFRAGYDALLPTADAGGVE